MTLAEKIQEMEGLSASIALNHRLLTTEEKQELENIQLRLEFALNNLLEETKIKEADLKIASMKAVLDVAHVKHE